MPYSAAGPTRPSPAELRSRIPGWGVDLDPTDRPAVPKLRFDPASTGAHWENPEEQGDRSGRERSIEHAQLTPVFGTATPLHGISGAVRRLAYRRYSEARAAHWLLLIAGDHVDAMESHIRSFFTLHPDNPVTQTGVLSEFRRHGISSRIGKNRADVRHQWLDPIIVAGPWVLSGLAVARMVKTLGSRQRH
jgi:hypothetical protein